MSEELRDGGGAFYCPQDGLLSAAEVEVLPGAFPAFALYVGRGCGHFVTPVTQRPLSEQAIREARAAGAAKRPEGEGAGE